MKNAFLFQEKRISILQQIKSVSNSKIFVKNEMTREKLFFPSSLIKFNASFFANKFQVLRNVEFRSFVRFVLNYFNQRSILCLVIGADSISRKLTYQGTKCQLNVTQDETEHLKGNSFGFTASSSKGRNALKLKKCSLTVLVSQSQKGKFTFPPNTFNR